jgi:6-phosphofructokinase 1
VMGHYCGYLAQLSGLATGAEFVYTHEDNVKLLDLQRDLDAMRAHFERGNRLSLAIRNERANDLYTTQFMCSLFEEEGGSLFDVRHAVLGHLQQGGNPTPDDRVRAAHLAARAVAFFGEQFARNMKSAVMCGYIDGEVALTPLDDFPALGDARFKRPAEQWWRALADVARQLS